MGGGARSPTAAAELPTPLQPRGPTGDCCGAAASGCGPRGSSRLGLAAAVNSLRRCRRPPAAAPSLALPSFSPSPLHARTERVSSETGLLAR